MIPATLIADTTQFNAAWNEQACLQGCVRGDLASQGLLYKHFYPTMMAVVYRYTRDRDQVSSILNNAFLKVFKNIHNFRGEGSLEGWIRRIIIHALADYFRYKHAAKEISHDAVPDTNETNILQPLSYDYKLLLELLHKLPPATRTVINLFIIDGYTHREIAVMTGISENTSKWHVAEGKKILQQQLSGMKK